MLSQYRNHLNRIRDCIDANNKVIRKIIKVGPPKFFDKDGSNDLNRQDDEYGPKIRVQDIESVSFCCFEIIFSLQFFKNSIVSGNEFFYVCVNF